eukprot:gene5365-6036_t
MKLQKSMLIRYSTLVSLLMVQMFNLSASVSHGEPRKAMVQENEGLFQNTPFNKQFSWWNLGRGMTTKSRAEKRRSHADGSEAEGDNNEAKAINTRSQPGMWGKRDSSDSSSSDVDRVSKVYDSPNSERMLKYIIGKAMRGMLKSIAKFRKETEEQNHKPIVTSKIGSEDNDCKQYARWKSQ